MTTIDVDMKGKLIAGGLRYAASPVFGLMAAVSALAPDGAQVCGPVFEAPLLHGMAWMYLLMCVFHLPTWLDAASARLEKSKTRTIPCEGD